MALVFEWTRADARAERYRVQDAAIAALHEAGEPLSTRVLAAAVPPYGGIFRLDAAAIYPHLRALEADGELTRRRHPHGRSVLWWFADAGESARQRAAARRVRCRKCGSSDLVVAEFVERARWAGSLSIADSDQAIVMRSPIPIARNDQERCDIRRIVCESCGDEWSPRRLIEVDTGLGRRDMR